MKSIVLLIFWLVSMSFANAQNEYSAKTRKRTVAVPRENSSQFYIEKGLVDKVYKQAMTLGANHSNSKGSLVPSFGVLSMEQFTLANDYFAIDYADQLGTIPFISFAFMSEFAKFKQMAFSFKGEFGYSYKQGTFKASSSAGPDIEDSITLQWVPVVAGILTDYTPSWARWIKPSLEVVAGAHWLNHVGTLDGLDQSVWVPVYGGGVSLTFFPGSKTDVFGGITFAADYMQSINSDQRIRGWMYKLGSTILL